MNFGVQYYRAPFPERHYWQDDLRRIKASGFNTVQLWISWGWVEAEPGKFDYSDYDELIALAKEAGFQVILSPIGEIQPNWVERLLPESAMVDNFGRRVISSARAEHHFGITPGGCTDHPEIQKHMKRFIQETGRRYAGLTHLAGWDIWNELRWNIQADGLVCYCSHTQEAFREFLKKRYGSLEGLNQAWKRRYCDWLDVKPGKLPDRGYPEMIAFLEFITVRANEHALWRYQAMREVDPVHIITAHGAQPCVLADRWDNTTPIDRGNDWDLADGLDGIGCSSFPQWFGVDDADFGVRIDLVKSAARGKKVWLSELQGGRAAIGFNIYGTVRAAHQQRWLWNGLACGADTILFWCWRDEVFGRESSGFGISGNDGHAEERLQATAFTGNLWREYAELWDDYQPEGAEVGILFSPESYYLEWAQEGLPDRMRMAVTGYARALTRLSIPLTVVEAHHLENLDNLKVLILPHVLVTEPELEKRLLSFVEQGGVLICESECGAFAQVGFYRYPEKRFLTQAGVQEVGRRVLEAGNNIQKFAYGNQLWSLHATQWLTPYHDNGGEALCCVRSYGAGKIVALGSYLGEAYQENYYPEFEAFISALISDSSVVPPVEVLTPERGEKEFLYVKCGRAKNRQLLFVFFFPGCQEATLKLREGWFSSGLVNELMSNQSYKINDRILTVKPGRFNIAVFCE